MIIRIYLLVVLSALCFCAEPDCPFGSPPVRLVDKGGRCDRYWECDDGLISDVYCADNEGYDPQAQKCSSTAPCLKENSPTKAKAFSGIIDLLSPKSFRGSFPAFPDIVKVGSSLLSPILGRFLD